MPWVYSEMVVDPILNSIFDEKLSVPFKAYDSFYDYQYQGRNVMDVLKDIYYDNNPIEEKIIRG